ncbi:MAG: hypothetical protein QOJ43_1945, partial [Gaiellaceae bacterium]|nr:hypothetical protein [Gaiellaceae bacterium]
VDMTERRAVEAALRRRNAELLRAQRVARLTSWEWDLDADWIRASGSGGGWPRWSDRPPSGSLDDLLVSWVHPDDRDRVRRSVTEAIAAGHGYVLDFRGLAPDGRIRHVSCKADVETDGDGKPTTVWVTSQDVTEQREAELALRASERTRGRLLAQLVTAQDDERRLLAADIHDHAIQLLHTAVLRAEALADLLADPQQIAAVQPVQEALRGAVVNLRQVIAGVRLPTLDGVEFVEALDAYLDEVTADWPVRHRFESRVTREPRPEVRAVLFRIVVEAVVNARKHSEASALTVIVESDDAGIGVEVADDGRGFEHGAAGPVDAGHFGLATMKERAELAGGWLTVHSRPGAGTRIEVWLPDGVAGDPPRS